MMLVNHPSKKSSSSFSRRIYTPPFTQVFVSKNRRQNRALLFSSKKEKEETETALAANNNGLATQIGSRQNFLRVSANNNAGSSSKSKPRRGESSIVFSGGGGWNDDVAFRECLITRNTKATEKGELFSLAVSLPKNDIDIEESMMLKKFSIPGQFVQMKTVETDKPAFIAIANGPTNARATRRFEFLVKRPKEGYRDATTGEEMASTAQKLCDAEVSTKVLVSEPMGKGFRVPSSEIGEVLCFATGSGISPVKSLLEEGFDDENTTKGRETHVFYGTRDKEHTAFAEELKNTLGGRVNIIHAYSADGNGYAQDYFKRMVDSGELTLKDPKKTIAVLCGQKEMTEQTIEVLEKVGVPRERILMNF